MQRLRVSNAEGSSLELTALTMMVYHDQGKLDIGLAALHQVYINKIICGCAHIMTRVADVLVNMSCTVISTADGTAAVMICLSDSIH